MRTLNIQAARHIGACVLCAIIGWYFAAPHGAMMLSGCFGLVRGVSALRSQTTQALR